MNDHTKIRNPYLYEHRDAFGQWHRRNLPKHCTAIDIDLLGYCNKCRHGIYLIESTTNPDKYHTVLQRIAARADVAGFVVVMGSAEDPKRFRIKQVYPAPVRWLFGGGWVDSAGMSVWLQQLRREHVCAP